MWKVSFLTFQKGGIAPRDALSISARARRLTTFPNYTETRSCFNEHKEKNRKKLRNLKDVNSRRPVEIDVFRETSRLYLFVLVGFGLRYGLSPDHDIAIFDGILFMEPLESDGTDEGRLGGRLVDQPREGVGAVGVFVGFLPLRFEHMGRELIVEDDVNIGPEDGNRHMVPFAGRFADVEVGRATSVDRAARTEVGGLSEGIVNLNFKGVGNPVRAIRRLDDDAAVGVFGRSELKVEFEVLILVFEPDHFVFVRAEDSVFVDRPDGGVEIRVLKLVAEAGTPAFLRRVGVANRRKLDVANFDRRVSVKPLEPDIAVRFKGRERFASEFLFDLGPVGPDGGVEPFRRVDAVYEFAVEGDRDEPPFANDRHCVPFARLLCRVHIGRLEPVERAARMIVRLFARVVEELNLERVGDPIVLIGTLEEEPSVGAFGEVEIERADKRGIFFFRPDNRVFIGAEFLLIVEFPRAFWEIGVFEVLAKERNGTVGQAKEFRDPRADSDRVARPVHVPRLGNGSSRRRFRLLRRVFRRFLSE